MYWAPNVHQALGAGEGSVENEADKRAYVSKGKYLEALVGQEYQIY